MTQRCRLLVRAQIGGSLREPGQEFTLPDGVLGPHRSIMTSHERIDINNDARRLLPDYENEPLYEVWDGDKWVKPAKAESDRDGTG